MSSVYCQAPLTPVSKPVIMADSFRRAETSPDCQLFIYDGGHHGIITVLDRQTGHGSGIRDVETGLKEFGSPWNHIGANFWLASVNQDILHELSHRRMGAGMAWDEAVNWVKGRANTCVGLEPRKYFEMQDAGVWDARYQPRDYMKYWQSFIGDSAQYSMSLRRQRNYGPL